MRRFTNQEKTDMRKARAEGARFIDLARIYGTCPSAIQYVCGDIEPKPDGKGYEHVTGSDLLEFLARWLPVNPTRGLPLPKWFVRRYNIKK